MGLLIKNAVIVNSQALEQEAKDILLEQGVIKEISSSISQASHQVIDAQGKLVLPGLIDLHCHLREPGHEEKETIETGSRSAAKGGFTTICCMPNTQPAIDSAKIAEGILEQSRRLGLINVFPVGAVTRARLGKELTDMMELKQSGCVALSDDGTSVASTQLMRHALEYAQMAGLVIMQHCEDPTLSQGFMNEGKISTLLGLKATPEISETIIVARDIELARYLKTRIHFCHISSGRSIELIRLAKEQGVAVTAEACPHHFTLTETSVQGFDTSTKVNPPLKTKADVDAVKQALKEGILDCIATDHAPHIQEEKELEFDKAPVGMIGFETAFALTVTELVENKFIIWPQLVERMSSAPARIIGLLNKGSISKGKDADIIIVDPNKEWTFKKQDIVSKSKNSPFIGRKLKGVVDATICSGKLVYQA